MTVSYLRSELNPAIKRNIKAIEKDLSRKCRQVWEHTNRLGERFLFGRFCDGGGVASATVVTLGHFDAGIRQFVPNY